MRKFVLFIFAVAALLLAQTSFAQQVAPVGSLDFAQSSRAGSILPGEALPKGIAPSVQRALAARLSHRPLLDTLASSNSTYGADIISTVAGGAFDQNEAMALNTGLGWPSGFVQDASGNRYVSAMAYNEVLKIDSAGRITVIAGNGTGGYSGDGGPGNKAALNSPTGLALDNDGNLYISDSTNGVIRKLNLSSGTITTYAGTGPSVGTVCSTSTDMFGDGCPATQAMLVNVMALAYSVQSHTLYLADSALGMVRQVDATGNITKLAGGYPTPTVCANATDAYGDGCPATSANLILPVGLALDSEGRLFIADAAADIIHVLPITASNPTISLYAGQANQSGTPMSGYAGDGGSATSALLHTPGTLVVDSLNNLYFVDTGNSVIREISSGIISTVAGTPQKSGYSGDGGPATNAMLSVSYISGLGVSPSTGSLSIVDTYNQRIRQILPNRSIETIAGNGYSNYIGNGGPATNAGMANPSGLAEDQSGNLYIADGNSVIWKVNAASGIITTVAGNGISGYSGDGGPATSANLNFPNGVAVDRNGNIYIADSSNSAIRKVDATTGVITTIAGGLGSTGTVCSAATDGIGDGCLATQAALNNPYSVAVDANGNIFIADSGNQVVREIASTTGVISTVAGTAGTYGYSGDGGPAKDARLYYPYAIALDGSGNLYISDSYNYRIRKVVASTGNIETIAGNGNYGYGGDGGPATSAALSTVQGIFTDNVGDVYIADTYNNVLREVDTTGTISTIAGNGTAGLAGDNGPAGQAELSLPVGGVIDGAGNLIFADSNNCRIRKIAISSVTSTPLVTVTPAVSTITSAQELSVGVSISGGSNNPTPTGAVTLSSGSYTSATTPLSSGGATLAIPAGSLSTGDDTLTVNYVPDISSSSAYNSASGTAPITVTSAFAAAITPTVSVTPSATSILATQGISVSVSVSGGAGNPVPTGTVSLSGEGYLSGSILLSGGSAVVNIPPGMLNGGNDTLTVNYSGDTNYSAASGTTSVTVTGTTQITATLDTSKVLSTGSVPLNYPSGVAVDHAGDVYITDSNNNRVVEVTNAGTSSVLNVGAPDGKGLKDPKGIAVDGTGNVYVADSINNRIVEVTASGVVNVLSIGAPGGKNLNSPEGVAVDDAGNLYIADTENGRVVKLTATGVVSVLNVGTPGGVGLSLPNYVAVDGVGNVYISDEGNYRVVELTSAGVASVLNTGNVIEPQGVAVDSAGNVYIANTGNCMIGGGCPIVKVTTAGAASELNNIGTPGGEPLNFPQGLAVDSSGNLFVVDTDNSRVVKIATTGSQDLGQTEVGAAGIPVTLSYTIDGYSGNSYTPAFQMRYGKEASASAAACAGGAAPEICTVKVTFKPAYPGPRTDALEVIDPSSGDTPLTQTLVYGTGNSPLSVYPAASVTVLNLGSLTVLPQSAAADSAGNVYIADTGNSRIVEVNAAGTASVLNTGTFTLGYPQGVAVDGGGNVYIADTGNNRVVMVAASGTASVLSTGSVNVDPQGIAVDPAGNVYVTDVANRIVKIAPNDVVSTISAGNVNLSYAYGLTVDGNGNIYVANQGSNNIVKITPVGVASVLSTGSLTLSPANGVAVDSAGDVYIADSGNNRVVQVTPSGAASVLNVGTPGGAGLSSPYGITVDGAGDLYIADYGINRVVRVVQAQAVRLSFASTKVGGTSSDSPKGMTVQNIGNEPLNISALATVTSGQAKSSFNLDSSGTTCTGSTALAPGAACDLSVAFQPLVAGALAGTLNLTDNNLNAVSPNNVQQIDLSGTGITLPTPLVNLTATSSSVTTAQSLTVTVVVSGGSGQPTPTGTITLTNGSYASSAATLVNGTAIINIAAGSLAIGNDTLTASYTPDAGSSSIYSSATGTGAVAVTQAAPTVTVTPSTSSITTLQALTVSIAVAGTPTPTGSVTLSSGSYSSAATSLSSGTAIINIPARSLAIGSDTLTASYTPDAGSSSIYSSATGTGPVAVTHAAPTVTVTPSTSSITTLQALTVNIAVAGTPTPTGAVILGSGSYTSAALSLSAGAASINIPAGSLSAGSDLLTATYTPDASSSPIYAGATSTATVTVTQANPAPVINSLTPAITSAGTSAFTLTVNGAGFVATSVVYWGTSALSTQYVSATKLTAQIPASDVTSAGTSSITVQTPIPGGGNSNPLMFEIDSVASGSTPPTFTTVTATVTPGATATYLVTLPSSATNISATCLNLPSGASCTYSATSGTVTITTSSTTPAGTYQITVIFNETVSGAAAAWVFLPILLLPFLAGRRRITAIGQISLLVCLAVALTAASMIGCGGGGAGGGSTTPQTHQVTSSAAVSLVVQ